MLKVESIGKRGSSIIEIIIACALFSILIGAVVLLVFSNEFLVEDSSTSATALAYAQSDLIEARALAHQNFGSLVSLTNTKQTYTITRTVAVVDAVTKKVSSTVTWSEHGRALSLSLSTLVANVSPDECSLSNSDDWSHVRHFDFPTTSLVPGSSNGFGIADVAVARGKLYLAAQSTVANGPTFFIFDIPTDPSLSPIFRGSVDNAPTISSTGITAIAVTGAYAFAANGTNSNFGTCSVGPNCAQLQTISISDPVHPTLVANTKVPSVTGSGGQSIGASITYQNGYLYLGLRKTGSGPEFSIFDVGANTGSPTNPRFLGSYSVGRTINSIRIVGDYAYLATDDSARELIVLNIHDKTHPTLAGIFNAPGTTNFGLGFSLGLSNDLVYFGRSWVGNAPELYILDSNTTPAVLGSQEIGSSINALFARKARVLLVTDAQFQVWDISNATAFAPLASVTLAGPGTALSCAGKTVYAAQTVSSNQDVLTAFTP
jgi:hypothetical protein